MSKIQMKKKAAACLPLLALYCGCVLARYLMALATNCFPTVYIDEFLYYSMGRSIATEGALLYRGQMALYNYIVYPLALSPVYFFFRSGANYYRLIQLWNILLMSLSVFPVYGLWRAMFGERKKALWLAALTMLLPDFILGQFIFSEAVIYPLFYSLMYCVYRYLKQPGTRYAVWTGVLGALLYFSKPGAVVPAIAALMLFAGRAVGTKSKKEGVSALLGIAALAAVFFLFKLLTEKAFSYSGSFFSIYDEQLNDYPGMHFDVFFLSAARYPYYFLLACGVLPAAAALWRFRWLDRENKQFFLLTACCVAAMLIGTAWAVNRPERTNILYLRYVDMYLPLVLAFCLSPGSQPEPAAPGRKNIRTALLLLLLGYGAVCTAVWGSTVGIGKPFDTHFLISLAVLFADNVKGIANILAVLALAASLYITVRYADKKRISAVCCAVFAVSMAVNNIAGYAITRKNTSPEIAVETLQMQRDLAGEEYVFVHDDNVCDFGLDVNTDRNIAYITMNDFYLCMHENQGVYTPLLPRITRGVAAVRPTPDVQALILEDDVHPMILFSSAVSRTCYEKSNYCIVRFQKGERIVDSMISNLKKLVLQPDAKANLTTYNGAWLGRPAVVRLEIESEKDQPLEIIGSKVYDNIPLSAGRHWYALTFPSLEAGYNLIVHDCDIRICGFGLLPAENAE